MALIWQSLTGSCALHQELLFSLFHSVLQPTQACVRTARGQAGTILQLAGHSGMAPVSASRKQPGWSKAELQRLIVREFPPELTLDESEVLCYTENEQNEMEKELTDEISRAWSGMSTRQDKNRKGLKKRTAATT